MAVDFVYFRFFGVAKFLVFSAVEYCFPGFVKLC